MPDLIAKGAAWLAAQRTAHLSKDVAYAAGATVLTVPATVGRTTFEVETAPGSGVFQKTESRDFIVPAGSLVADPVRGDRIRETVDGAVLVYEVLAPAGQPCWQWADAHRTARRIHTALVATETAP